MNSSGVVADDATWYVGEVKTIMKDGRFGFVQCAETFQIYGDDVFLHSSQVPLVTEGMLVEFRVHVNARGKPQAVDLVPSNQQTTASTPLAPRPQVLSHGGGLGVRSVTPKTDLWRDGGREWLEAVVHNNGVAEGVPMILDRLAVVTGDAAGVANAVMEWAEANGSAGRPRGWRLLDLPKGPAIGQRPSPYSNVGKGHVATVVAPSRPHSNVGKGHVATVVAPPSFAASANDDRYEGVVKAIVSKNDGRPPFGFIQCEDTMALYGEDVFLHSTQVDVLQMHQQVTFGVQVNAKGKPQATDVEIVE